ncbi:MAG TPA: class I SAM-dependent methyltransferase, partial [Cytophagaceae bacterium]
LEKLDMVFFDANHKYDPTLNYFNLCLQKVHEESIFIFDDIYWSKEMTKAWKEIIAHPSVILSIDLFHFGLVFFRKNQPKQHFKLKI